MKTLFKNITIGMLLIAGSQAMEQIKIIPENFPQEITSEILNQTSMCKILDQGTEVSFKSSMGDLRLICKNWKNIIDEEIDQNKTRETWNKKKQDFFINFLISTYKTIGHGEECQLFLNGKLKYTPDKGAPVFLPIANLEHPFSGQFNLSLCGDASKYLIISTGSRKERRWEDNNKLEVWYSPCFFVKENPLYKELIRFYPKLSMNCDNQDKPIGIFWNWGTAEHRCAIYQDKLSIGKLSVMISDEEAISNTAYNISLVRLSYSTCNNHTFSNMMRYDEILPKLMRKFHMEF